MTLTQVSGRDNRAMQNKDILFGSVRVANKCADVVSIIVVGPRGERFNLELTPDELSIINQA